MASSTRWSRIANASTHWITWSFRLQGLIVSIFYIPPHIFSSIEPSFCSRHSPQVGQREHCFCWLQTHRSQSQQRHYGLFIFLVSTCSHLLQDSEVYAYLLKSIDPSIDVAAILANTDNTARAEAVLTAADRHGLRKFVQPADIVSGNHRLNFAFVANLFNNAKYVFACFIVVVLVAHLWFIRHVKGSGEPLPQQSNREAELLALIERLQMENEALKRENERLKEGQVEGSKLKRVCL